MHVSRVIRFAHITQGRYGRPCSTRSKPKSRIHPVRDGIHALKGAIQGVAYGSAYELRRRAGAANRKDVGTVEGRRLPAYLGNQYAIAPALRSFSIVVRIGIPVCAALVHERGGPW